MTIANREMEPTANMPSLAIATIEHVGDQSPQQNDWGLSHADKFSTLHANDGKSSTKTEHLATQITPPDPNPATANPNIEWKAGKEEWLIMAVIAIVSLMVALDATILVPVLPVRDFYFDANRSSRQT